MRFVRIPTKKFLVPAESIERLRKKFLESKRVADGEAFWRAVQESKQPIISEQPDYREEWDWPRDGTGSPIDYEDLPV